MRDPPIKKTINNIGDKRVAIKTAGKEKLGYTLGPAITMSGNQLRTLLVWPSKGVKKFKINIPLNLYICYREAGSWVDAKVVEEYTRQIIKPYFRTMPKNLKGLILVDNHSSHVVMKEVLSQLNVEVIYFPPNCTGLLQPLDISFNKEVKDQYREMWLQWQLDPEGNKKMIVIPHKNKDDLTHETLIMWISRSLKLIEKENIINCWNPLKNGINKNDLDASNFANCGEEDLGDDDDSIFNDLIDNDQSSIDDEDSDEEQNIPEFLAEMLDFEVFEETEI